MNSLENKQAAYVVALTAFKRHEAFGWHHLSPFAVGASVEEATTIQEGIDTYHRLQEELCAAKRRLKNARYKANRRARNATHSSHEEPSVPNPRKEAEDKAQPHTKKEEVVKAEPEYHEWVISNWYSHNATYYAAKDHFRRFAVKNGLASFQVAKDGACYEGVSLDVNNLLVPGLRLWTSVLQIPYASKMRRAELVKVLQPVLRVLANGPSYRL